MKTLSSQFPDRGSVGPTPALTRLADEAFLDYIRDVRTLLVMGRMVTPQAIAAVESAGLKFEPNEASVEAIRDVIRREVPESRTGARMQRSAQEALWRRVSESYDLRRPELLRMLDQSDQRGPGTVRWDPAYIYPTYTQIEPHLQKRGFVGDMLSGAIFDYGTYVYHSEKGEPGHFHKAIASRVEGPSDGRISRIMDIGCAVGQLTSALKRRFPNATVWGSDISAGMVRYAHYRAMQQNLELHFMQKAAEDLDELEPGSFDLVTHTLLFHESPLPVVDQTIKNVFRLLRPGGTFWFFDFPTLGNDPKGIHYTGVLGAFDSADNSEPYAPEFTRCNIEQRLQDAGFKLRYEDPEDIKVRGRVCDKPA